MLSLEHITDSHWKAYHKGRIFEFHKNSRGEWVITLARTKEEVFRVPDGNLSAAIDFVQHWGDDPEPVSA